MIWPVTVVGLTTLCTTFYKLATWILMTVILMFLVPPDKLALVKPTQPTLPVTCPTVVLPRKIPNHNCKLLYLKLAHKVLLLMLAVLVFNCTLVVCILPLLAPTPELTTLSPLSVMALTLPVLNTGLSKTLGVLTGVTMVTS